MILLQFLFVGVRSAKLVQICTNVRVLTSTKEIWREYVFPIINLTLDSHVLEELTVKSLNCLQVENICTHSLFQ
jgi:hypothetical protein